MLVAIGALGGAPGVTTLAAVLAAAWPPGREPVLVEADASGGDMAAWHRRDTDVGVVSLAAASRHSGSEGVLLGHSQELAGGLRVVLAPVGPHQTRAAVDLIAEHPGVLRQRDVVTVLDVGRMVPGSAGTRLVAHADVVVVVSSTDVAQLRRLRECAPVLAELGRRGTPLGLAVAAGRFGDAEISVQTRLPVWVRLAQDAATARVVCGQGGALGVGRRRLVRAARELARRIEAKHAAAQRQLRLLMAGGEAR